MNGIDPVLIVTAVVSLLVMSYLSAWVAGQKGRSPAEGFILGFLFSLLGLFVELLLPSQSRTSILPRFCMQCGTALTPPGRFCGRCGSPVRVA